MATTITTKARLLSDFCMEYKDEGFYEGWFERHDLVQGMVMGLLAGWLTLTPEGEGIVHDAYVAMCDELGIDYHGDFENTKVFWDILDV